MTAENAVSPTRAYASQSVGATPAPWQYEPRQPRPDDVSIEILYPTDVVDENPEGIADRFGQELRHRWFDKGGVADEAGKIVAFKKGFRDRPCVDLLFVRSDKRAMELRDERIKRDHSKKGISDKSELKITFKCFITEHIANVAGAGMFPESESLLVDTLRRLA